MRLIPPRASFPSDITEEEQSFMVQHFAFWREQIGAGVALAVGSVLDPGAVWGLAVVELLG
jgi:hypothetical protein